MRAAEFVPGTDNLPYSAQQRSAPVFFSPAQKRPQPAALAVSIGADKRFGSFSRMHASSRPNDFRPNSRLLSYWTQWPLRII